MIKVLRLMSFLEGVSFLLLLGIAMPFKYWLDMPQFVPYAGMFHGVMFLGFLVLLLVACQVKRWSIQVFLLGFMASLLPFMPFWFERYIHRLDEQKSPYGY
ncbi:MAG: DUF3817 domain-containing protein [Moraxella sp.]|nr:DUF3817 domain-containing protein [Moraxella sp.]